MNGHAGVAAGVARAGGLARRSASSARLLRYCRHAAIRQQRCTRASSASVSDRPA
jgi:hypothetical protein